MIDHAARHLCPPARPSLCVVVDVEEEFDWRRPFRASNTGCEAISHLARAQAIFARHGVTPCYLVDHPVAADEQARNLIGPWLAAGACDLGAQLHPWVTPPHEEVVCTRNSFPHNLDPDLEKRKLATLMEVIREGFGAYPRAYKAGRYGLGDHSVDTLAGFGFEIDTSVVPHWTYRGAGGGRDFIGLPDQPFWLSPRHHLLELPFSVVLTGPLGRRMPLALERLIFSPTGIRQSMPGILSRLGLASRIKLSPEGSSLAEMKQAVDALLSRDRRYLCLSFHSPSLLPGCTPYVRTEADLENFLDRLDRILAYIIGQRGVAPTGVFELRRQLMTAPAALAA